MSPNPSTETSLPPETPFARSPLPPNVRLLGFTSLINDIASEMIYPLMPQFLIAVLGGNKVHLGVIEGFADSTASLLKLWSGAWSDRAGRRKGFIVFGYLLAAVSRPLIGVATAPWHLFAARTADRFGKGVRAAPRDALVADSTPPDMRGRAFGFNRAMDHLGAAIGPLLAAAFLLAWPGQLRTLFLLTIIPGLFVAGLVTWGLKEQPITSAAKGPPRLSLEPLGPKFKWFLVALVVFTLGNASDAFLLVPRGRAGRPHRDAAHPVVRVPRREKRRQLPLRARGRSSWSAAADSRRLGGVRRCVPCLRVRDAGVARVDAVSRLCGVLRAHRTS